MKLGGKELPTDKQQATIKGIRKRCKKAKTIMPTPQIVTAAVAEVYDTKDEHSARTIGSELLAKPHFRAALGFECDELKSYIAEEVLRNIRGENPIFGKQVDIYRDSLKLAARMAFPEKTKIVYSDENKFADRSQEDLKFMTVHGHWPEEDADPVMHSCACTKTSTQ